MDTDQVLQFKLGYTDKNGNIKQVFFQMKESTFLTMPESESIDRYLTPAITQLKNLCEHPEIAQSRYYKPQKIA